MTNKKIPKIFCKRCGVSYNIVSEPHSDSAPTFICEVPRCFRRYKEQSLPLEKRAKYRVYMTAQNVKDTIKLSESVKSYGGLVDNGGLQEGIE